MRFMHFRASFLQQKICWKISNFNLLEKSVNYLKYAAPAVLFVVRFHRAWSNPSRPKTILVDVPSLTAVWQGGRLVQQWNHFHDHDHEWCDYFNRLFSEIQNETKEKNYQNSGHTNFDVHPYVAIGCSAFPNMHETSTPGHRVTVRARSSIYKTRPRRWFSIRCTELKNLPYFHPVPHRQEVCGSWTGQYGFRVLIYERCDRWF